MIGGDADGNKISDHEPEINPVLLFFRRREDLAAGCLLALVPFIHFH